MKKLRPEHKILVKRSALVLTIVLLLVAAAWVNGTMQDEPLAANASPAIASRSPQPAASTQASAQKKTGDYFADFRTDRAAIRAEQIALLDSVIDSGGDKAAVREALTRKTALSAYMEQEFAIEQTLMAKGYADVAAIVRDDLVTVAVKKADLNQTDAARILEAAKNETGQDAGHIKTIPVE